MAVTKLQAAIVSAVVLIGMGFLWRIQHKAAVNLREENRSLRQQNEQLAELAGESDRLSNLVEEAKSSQTLGNGQMNELLKLRAEVGGLRRLTNELEKVEEGNQRLKTSPASASGRPNTGTQAA